MGKKMLQVKIYHGYGHAHNLIVLGHVLHSTPRLAGGYANGVLSNVVRLIRLFLVKPVAGAKVRLVGAAGLVETITAKDGFFKLEWQEPDGKKAGWHNLQVDCVDDNNTVLASGMGRLFVPHITQYSFVSDIDDTVLVSHSATLLKRLRVMFTKNPHTRTAFPDVVEHYRRLAVAKTTDNVPNPFFYVSSSEWNLYDDLVAFFRYNQLPEGVFLLNSIKRWYQLIKTGKTKHGGKLLRIIRIMEAFPNQQFVLLGDNSQKDPLIYEAVAKKYPGRIYAVYLRNVRRRKEKATRQILDGLKTQNVHTCLFSSSEEAISHSQCIGLIEEDNDLAQ